MAEIVTAENAAAPMTNLVFHTTQSLLYIFSDGDPAPYPVVRAFFVALRRTINTSLATGSAAVLLVCRSAGFGLTCVLVVLLL